MGVSAATAARLLLPLGLLLSGAARAGTDDERARELEAVRRAIEERRERVEAFERRERGLFETLEEMDLAASRLAREAAGARQRARAARELLAGLEGRATEIAARRERTRQAMAVRAVALYKTGEAGPARLLFAASSLREILARSRVLRILLDHDRQLLLRFEADTLELERTRAEAAAAAAENEHALALAAAQGRELDRERAEKQRLLEEVRGDRAAERAALQELEAAALALEETLARLRGRPERPGAALALGHFESLRGVLPPPVEAPVERAFGRVLDAEFRTETFRKGVDFAAPAGDPVRAVAPGEVRFAGWFRGYGRIVILDHGDGYFSVSGHLEEVAVEVGQLVEAGEELGTVGETGSLSGPRLYFEIRRGAEPLDPAGWLQAPP